MNQPGQNSPLESIPTRLRTKLRRLLHQLLHAAVSLAANDWSVVGIVCGRLADLWFYTAICRGDSFGRYSNGLDLSRLPKKRLFTTVVYWIIHCIAIVCLIFQVAAGIAFFFVCASIFAFDVKPVSEQTWLTMTGIISVAVIRHSLCGIDQDRYFE